MAGSRNIIGESFKPYVKNQIKSRQDLLSSQYRDDDLLKYINNKTSWVRLTSGVDIDENRSQNLSYSINGENVYIQGSLLAKYNVLSNYYEDNKNSTFGNYISSTQEYAQGIVPPPGITAVEIKSLNRGSLREATIQILCHSVEQFRIIEALHLRLKFSMLLEWGHTIWYNNDLPPQLQTDIPNEIHQNYLENKYDQDSLLQTLETAREESCGNYDGFLGYVKNFSWSIRKDGGYDITLKLITMGDVIESLKINMNYPTNFKTPPQSSPTTDILPPITQNKDKSTINQIIYALKSYLDIIPSNNGFAFENGYKQDIGDPLGGIGLSPGTVGGLTARDVVNYTQVYSTYDLISPNYIDQIEKDNLYSPSNMLANQELVCLTTYKTEPESNTLTSFNKYYIKLGALLRIIESFLIRYDTSKNKEGEYKPLFYIDHDYDTNLCLTLPLQSSINPNICFLPPSDSWENYIQGVSRTIISDQTFTDPDTGEVVFSSSGGGGFFNQITPDFRVQDYPFVGKFMHVLVNFDHILTTLDENVDDDGKLSLYDFLSKLLNKIQSSIGNINNFEITYDEITNYFVIRDNNIIPGGAKFLKKDTSLTEINASTFGSFVTEVTIQSELSNNFATIISIGAQVNANKVGENATALSRLNVGYTDRLIREKSGVLDQINSSSTGSRSPKEAYLNNFRTYINFLSKITLGRVSQDEIENEKRAMTDVFSYQLGYYTQNKNIPGVGFIPINLQITMDGLSGPRIYEVYTINEYLLPDNYKNNIQFITKGVSHRIDDKGWFTTLESFSGPKSDVLIPITESSQTSSTPTTNVAKAEQVINPKKVSPNKLLPPILQLAGYTPGTMEYELALSIGTKEGWNPKANGGIGSRSYRNNNPGNLDYSESLKQIDPGVQLENNSFSVNRFAKFSTPELGAKALVETKIKRWADGNMPITSTNSKFPSFGLPAWVKPQKPNIAQFIYTYAPPNQNNSEGYVLSVVDSLKRTFPNINKNSIIKDFL